VRGANHPGAVLQNVINVHARLGASPHAQVERQPVQKPTRVNQVVYAVTDPLQDNKRCCALPEPEGCRAAASALVDALSQTPKRVSDLQRIHT
jgi:hypothetical protein